MENLSGSDVFEAIRERAEALWNDALRRAARGSASTKASLFHVVFSVAYMLGLDGQLVARQLGLEVAMETSVEVTHARYRDYCLQLVQLHNELAHMRLPQLDERSVGLGTALRKAFTLYATANSGSAIDAQGLVKLCGDAGLLQPTGALSVNALTTLLSAHDPGTGTHGSQLNYRAFMRVLAAIGAESLADAFTPVAGQGLQARPTPLEQLVLPEVLDLTSHWHLPGAGLPIPEGVATAWGFADLDVGAAPAPAITGANWDVDAWLREVESGAVHGAASRHGTSSSHSLSQQGVQLDAGGRLPSGTVAQGGSTGEGTSGQEVGAGVSVRGAAGGAGGGVGALERVPSFGSDASGMAVLTRNPFLEVPEHKVGACLEGDDEEEGSSGSRTLSLSQIPHARGRPHTHGMWMNMPAASTSGSVARCGSGVDGADGSAAFRASAPAASAPGEGSTGDGMVAVPSHTLQAMMQRLGALEEKVMLLSQSDVSAGDSSGGVSHVQGGDVHAVLVDAAIGQLSEQVARLTARVDTLEQRVDTMASAADINRLSKDIDERGVAAGRAAAGSRCGFEQQLGQLAAVLADTQQRMAAVESGAAQRAVGLRDLMSYLQQREADMAAGDGSANGTLKPGPSSGAATPAGPGVRAVHLLRKSCAGSSAGGGGSPSANSPRAGSEPGAVSSTLLAPVGAETPADVVATFGGVPLPEQQVHGSSKQHSAAAPVSSRLKTLSIPGDASCLEVGHSAEGTRLNTEEHSPGADGQGGAWPTGSHSTDMYTKLPADMQALADAVNAMIARAAEHAAAAHTPAAAAPAPARASSTAHLSTAVMEQGEAQRRLSCQLSALEAAIIKVAKQCDTLQADLHVLRAEGHLHPTTKIVMPPGLKAAAARMRASVDGAGLGHSLIVTVGPDAAMPVMPLPPGLVRSVTQARGSCDGAAAAAAGGAGSTMEAGGVAGTAGMGTLGAPEPPQHSVGIPELSRNGSLGRVHRKSRASMAGNAEGHDQSREGQEQDNDLPGLIQSSSERRSRQSRLSEHQQLPNMYRPTSMPLEQVHGAGTQLDEPDERPIVQRRSTNDAIAASRTQLVPLPPDASPTAVPSLPSVIAPAARSPANARVRQQLGGAGPVSSPAAPAPIHTPSPMEVLIQQQQLQQMHHQLQQQQMQQQQQLQQPLQQGGAYLPTGGPRPSVKLPSKAGGSPVGVAPEGVRQPQQVAMLQQQYQMRARGVSCDGSMPVGFVSGQSSYGAVGSGSGRFQGLPLPGGKVEGQESAHHN